jgi:Transmembrane secretion effector
VTSLLRRNPGFGRLWTAAAISLVGDWLSFVAVAALAMQSGGGAFGLALVFAAHALPGAVLAPFAGAIVDGMDRRHVLIAADVIAAVITIAMMIVALAGVFEAIIPLLLVRSGVTSLVPPGESAAIRRLVGTNDLLAANSILAATWSVSYVAGMALGGAAALLGPAIALGLDAGSFAIAAGVHAMLPAMPSPAKRRRLGAIMRATPSDTMAALRVAWANRPLLRAVLGKTPIGLAAGAAWVSLNMIGATSHPFGAAALSFGVLQAVRGAGTGIGPPIAARLVRGGVDEQRLQMIAVALAMIAIAALGVVRGAGPLVALCLVWGIGTGSNWVLSHAALQRYSSDEVIGRLAAFDELLVTLAMVISAFVGAAVITWIGMAAAPLAGVGLGLLGLLAAAALLRR